MHERAITGLMLVVAAIHLLPVAGVVGGAKLATLYGIEITDDNLELLLRHRAVLFGILGVFLCCAAFTPAMQPMAFLAAMGSVLSFLLLSGTVEQVNAAMGRVVTADIIATLSLIAAIAIYIHKNHYRP